MPELTPMQLDFVNRLKKRPNCIYFKRNKETGKEAAYIGKTIVNGDLFFFFYEIGFLEYRSQYSTKVNDYYNLYIVNHKLDEYINEELG